MLFNMHNGCISPFLIYVRFLYSFLSSFSPFAGTLHIIMPYFYVFTNGIVMLEKMWQPFFMFVLCSRSFLSLFGALIAISSTFSLLLGNQVLSEPRSRNRIWKICYTRQAIETNVQTFDQGHICMLEQVPETEISNLKFLNATFKSQFSDTKQILFMNIRGKEMVSEL